MEFAAIYSYDLTTVILAGPAVLLAIVALGAAWMNRVPRRIGAPDLAPVIAR